MGRVVKSFRLGWVTNPTNPNFWVGSKKSLNPTQLGPCTPLILKAVLTSLNFIKKAQKNCCSCCTDRNYIYIEGTSIKLERYTCARMTRTNREMVLEPDTERCANLLAVLQRGVDMRRCVSKDAGLQRGGFGGGLTSIGGWKECQRGRWAPKRVDCDVPYWLGSRTNQHL